MKHTLISTIGMSPPIVTEGISYLKSRGIDVRTAILLITQDEQVKKCGKVARAAIIDRFPEINVRTEWLSFEDTFTEKENDEYMRLLATLIRNRRVESGDQYIHLNLAGGRKGMTALSIVVGSLMEVNSIFHVISHDVQVMNVALERIRAEIDMLDRSNDYLHYYKEHKDVFDPVMFPEPSSYTVIDLPVIPYPKDYLKEIIDLVRNDITLRTDTGLSDRMLDALNQMGFINSKFDREVVLTKKGMRLRKIFLSG